MNISTDLNGDAMRRVSNRRSGFTATGACGPTVVIRWDSACGTLPGHHIPSGEWKRAAMINNRIADSGDSSTPSDAGQRAKLPN